MSDMIRVAILDDHQGILDGYTFRLSNHPDIAVVGTARFGEELEKLLAHQPVDVLLLDMQVPSSPENPNLYPILFAIPKLLQTYPNLSILAISMHNQRTLIQSTLDAGASGYILKDDYAAIQELASIVRSVANQGIYLSQQAFNVLNRQQVAGTAPELSARQLEALSLCAAHPDASTYELAGVMNIAHSTLRNLLSGAYVKLNVPNRASAVARARQLGLIPPDTSRQQLPFPESPDHGSHA